MKRLNFINKETVILLAFLILSILERTLLDLGPNIELVTTTIILTSFFFGRKKSFWLGLAILIVTDRLIGNNNIFLFTWSGFLIPAILSLPLIKYLKSKIKIKIAVPLITGISANIFFFIWTNFGVWILDSWGMYEKSLGGLITCYVNALPFLRNQLISSVVFIPLLYIATKLILNLKVKPNLSLALNKSN